MNGKDLAKAYLYCFGLLMGIMMTIAGLIVAWPHFIAVSGIFVQVLALLFAIGLVVGLPASVIWHVQVHRKRTHLRLQREEDELKAIQDENRRKNEQHAMQLYLARTRIAADERGNRPALVGIDPAAVMLLPSGNYVENVPHTLHYVYQHKGTTVQEQRPGQAQLAMPKPTLDELIRAIKPNSFEFALGRSLTTQQFLTIPLPDAHIKLIGGSRMGKSCEAAAILDQGRQTHDVEHLRFALLDLEYKTSRLFEDDPHLLTVKTAYKNIKMHAKDVAQVAECFIYLHMLMLDRYQLTDAELAFQPHVLIYLEEFLYWKKLLSQLVAPELREKALAAFAGIATRGLKVGLHLMACAQVDYADEELKDAMAQFLAVNIAFSVKPSAAQAAGFVSSELLKRNYADRTPGQFVVEAIGGADIGVAPEYDVRAKLQAMTGAVDAAHQARSSCKTLVSEVPENERTEQRETQAKDSRNTARNEANAALQVKVAQVMQNPGENMADCIKRVWQATPGDNARYKQAKQEYIQVQEMIHAMARKAMHASQSSEVEE